MLEFVFVGVGRWKLDDWFELFVGMFVWVNDLGGDCGGRRFVWDLFWVFEWRVFFVYVLWFYLCVWWWIGLVGVLWIFVLWIFGD